MFSIRFSEPIFCSLPIHRRFLKRPIPPSNGTRKSGNHNLPNPLPHRLWRGKLRGACPNRPLVSAREGKSEGEYLNINIDKTSSSPRPAGRFLPVPERRFFAGQGSGDISPGFLIGPHYRSVGREKVHAFAGFENRKGLASDLD